MDTQIVSIDKIKTEALSAAKQYSDVNDACPYPFFTPAGQLFKQFFVEALASVVKKGDCDLCGRWSAHMVDGVCTPCRDARGSM